MKRRQEQTKNNLLLQYVIGLSILLFVVTSSFLYLVFLSMQPYQKARSEGEELAKQYAGIEQTNQFDIYNGLESYYSILGQNNKQESLAVLIGKSDHKIYVYQLDKGVSQEKAEAVVKEKGATEIDKITFGRYGENPVWEVKSGGDYYLVDFETGKLLERENL